MADLKIFLPNTVIRLVSESREKNPFSVEEGTILFCDVAGFTPLTEALSSMGKEGSEELTKILNRYFTDMIEIIDELGGDVIRFGGDAMTILFPKGLEDSALYASHRMMEKMDSFSEIKTKDLSFSLAMKIGVAYGKTVFGVIGNSQTGMDYYAAGLPLDESAEAEHRAVKGKIILHPSFQKIYSAKLICMDDGFGESRPVGAKPLSTGRKNEQINISSEIGSLVPGYLVDRAGEGTLGEHRGTTVIFLGFEGLRPGEDLASSAEFHRDLNRFFLHLASAARNYGGIINKVDMGDKGMKAIFLFGSPYALENKEEMAIRFALEVRDKNPLADKISLKMGVTSSALFNGPVGSPKRREFTVMGDGINTAARLMQKAPANEIYCDEKTMDATKEAITYEKLEPLMLKGKEKAVPVFVPAGFAKKEELFDLPVIIERDETLEKIKNLLLRKAKPILITGEAGLGKTVLIEWARRELRSLNILTTRVFLAPYHRTRSYSLWKGALRSLIGAQKNDTPEKIRSLRDGMLEKESKPYASLLNAILGIEEDEKESIRSLGPKEKKELTFAIVEKLLLRGGERAVLADNIEMADPLSLELLNFLHQGNSDLPVKFIGSCRSVSADIDRICGNFEKLEIMPLSEKGTVECLTANIKLTRINQHLANWFFSKTSGNPKLISAISQILKEKKIISTEGHGFMVDEDLLFTTPFPERLEDIYLGKIDELPRAEREIVQIASVLGYSVSLFLLSFAAQIEKNEVKNIAEELIKKGIFKSDSWGERQYLKFAESFLREAVYNALPFTLKRDVHLKCASFLEAECGKKPALFPIIAGHFKGAGDTPRANLYNKKSAYDALSRFDNLTAMRFLEQTCEGELNKENLDCGFSLMEVYGNLGRVKEEIALISRIENIKSRLDDNEKLRFLSFETKKAIMESDFPKAEELFSRSEKLALEINDNLALSKIYVNMAGGLYGPRGDLDKAWASLEKCLNLPDSKEFATSKVIALFNSANILRHRGEDEQALALFKNTYQKARSLRLIPQMANVAVNIASMLYELGRYSEALIWAKKAKKWAETFSLRQLLLIINRLQAIIEHILGWSEKASEELKVHLVNAKRFNNQYIGAITAEALIDVESSLLNINSSVFYSREALEKTKEIGSPQAFRNAFLEALKVFYSLSARKEAGEFLEQGGYLSYLDETPPYPAVEPLLKNYLAWVHSKDGSFSTEDMAALSPDLKMDYLFFFLNIAVEKGDAEEAGRLLDYAFESLKYAPTSLSKVKLFFFGLAAGDKRLGPIRKEVWRIIKRTPMGNFGLRTLGLLWQNEKGRTKTDMRCLLISRLYRLKANSPAWAFEKLLNCSEIKSALKGEL
jgi:class 3 adenylate cyclase/predicted ATPase